MQKVKVNSKKEKTRKIIEVKTVWTDEEANELIKQGFDLLHGGVSHKDHTGYQAKTCFMFSKYSS